MNCPVEVAMTGSDPIESDFSEEETEEARPPTLPVHHAEDSPPVSPKQTPWKGLHPASLFINLLPQTWRTVKNIWPLVLLLFFGGGGPGSWSVDMLLILVFFMMTLTRTTVHFLTLRYRVHDGRLEIRSGLLNRRSRALDPARIQNMELVQNPFHKLTGLVELRVETAGDASATDGLLSALSVSEANSLKTRLQKDIPPEPEKSDTKPPLVKLDPIEILAFGLSKRRVGTVALLFVGGMEILGQIDPQTTAEVAVDIGGSALLGALVLAFVGTWVFSGTQALLRHYGFTLTRTGDRLVTQEGLLTRRSVEIPVSKVQLVRVDEPWLRRQMGFGTMLIETAAFGMADGQVRQAEGIVPMVDQEELGAIVQHATPIVAVDPWTVPLLPAHPRALYRGIIARLIRSSFFAIAVGALFHPWGWLALLLIPAAIPIAWLDWKKQGWLITDQAIVARRGYFTRKTWTIARNKVQSVHVTDSPVLRLHGLGKVLIRVAGSQVSLPDIGINKAREVQKMLSPEGTQGNEE